MNHSHHNMASTPVEIRKKALLEDGLVYRRNILSAKRHVAEALGAEALTRSALSHAIHLAYTGLGRIVASKGLNIRSLVPAVVGGVSFLRRRALLWPVVKGGLAIAAAATAARFFLARKSKLHTR